MGERLIMESTGEIKSYWEARRTRRKWEKNREKQKDEEGIRGLDQ